MIVLATDALVRMDRDDPATGRAARRLIEDAWRAAPAASASSPPNWKTCTGNPPTVLLWQLHCNTRQRWLRQTTMCWRGNRNCSGRMSGYDRRNACVPEANMRIRGLSRFALQITLFENDIRRLKSGYNKKETWKDLRVFGASNY